MESKLSNDIEELLDEAERCDDEETADGDRLPNGIACREVLREKMPGLEGIWKNGNGKANLPEAKMKDRKSSRGKMKRSTSPTPAVR